MRWHVRFYDRKLEWMIATYAFFFGVWVALPFRAFDPIDLGVVLGVMSEWRWGVLFATVGFFHTLALFLNGAFWWTPNIRAVAAAVNLFAYAVFTTGICQVECTSSRIPTYGYLVNGMLILVLYNALRDCLLARRARLVQSVNT